MKAFKASKVSYRVKKEHFSSYKQLYRGKNRASKLALLSNLFMIVRRLVPVYVAMFLAEYPWLQVVIFAEVGLVYIIYLGFAKPYNSFTRNTLNLLNEGFISLVVYMMMLLNDQLTDFDQYMHVNQNIENLITLNWLVIACTIIVTLLKDLCRFFKVCNAKLSFK